MAKVTTMNDKETVEVLRDLLARAEDGRLRGIAFAIKSGPHVHRIGFTGDYWHHPDEALVGAGRMAYKANQLIAARNDEPETGSMPL